MCWKSRIVTVVLPAMLLGTTVSVLDAQRPLTADQRAWLQRDIVVLFDVSKPIWKSWGPTERWAEDNLELVESMIAGTVDYDVFRGRWNVERKPGYPFNQSLPLAGNEDELLVARFGNYARSKSILQAQGHRLTEAVAEVVASVLRQPGGGAPRVAADFPDENTNFDLAQAMVYERMRKLGKMSGQGERGYYLVVISDREDWPGQNEIYNYREDTLAIQAWNREETYMLAMLALQDPNINVKPVLKITLQAVGFDPFQVPAVPEEKETIPQTEDIPQKSRTLPQQLQLLGGLAGARTRDKAQLAETNPPHFAWQVPFDVPGQRKFSITVDGVGSTYTKSAQPTSKTMMTWDEKLDRGFYKVTIAEAGLGSVDGFFEVEKGRRWPLWVALFSGIASLSVFLFTFWTLRKG